MLLMEKWLFLHLKIRDAILRNYLEPGTKPENGPLCNNDLDLLRNWKFDTSITEDKANMLTTQGWNDLRYLANHFQTMFPNILEKNYTTHNYKFRYTTSDRTNDSMKAFQEGLFGEKAYEHILTPLPLKDDILLKVNLNLFQLLFCKLIWDILQKSPTICVHRLIKMQTQRMMKTRRSANFQKDQSTRNSYTTFPIALALIITV